ncbi:MAG: sigma-70 family RNA polymerase sigma factor [Candidatus Omnitrophica bacterium]|nr:sigma-70 family RNA polymerase sigma factor [Candidatus Omnitrophota bacterium]
MSEPPVSHQWSPTPPWRGGTSPSARGAESHHLPTGTARGLQVVGSEETALVERAQRGDSSAFEALVRLHQQAVFAVALRMLGDQDEAQDVAQDVFVRAYQGIPAFRSEAKLSTWLVAITINLCRNRRRWWARRRRLIVASLDEPVGMSRAGFGEEGALGHEVADPSPSPASAAAQHEQQRFVISALQQLDEAHRSVVVLRDIHGYSYEEIADMLQCHVGTVKSRLSRARLHLRALLDGKL